MFGIYHKRPEYNPPPAPPSGWSGGTLVPPWHLPIPIEPPKRGVFDETSLYWLPIGSFLGIQGHFMKGAGTASSLEPQPLAGDEAVPAPTAPSPRIGTAWHFAWEWKPQPSPVEQVRTGFRETVGSGSRKRHSPAGFGFNRRQYQSIRLELLISNGQ